MKFRPAVLVVRSEQDLCWRGSVLIRGVFDGTHCIHLTAVTGGTHLEQTESFSGLLVGRLTKDVIEETQRNFQAMNTAIKQRVETKTPWAPAYRAIGDGINGRGHWSASKGQSAKLYARPLRCACLQVPLGVHGLTLCPEGHSNAITYAICLRSSSSAVS
jgi:hypothetical protein